MVDGPIFEAVDKNSAGDNLTVDERNGHFNVTVEEPWAGDTETGFGQETSVSLDAEQAKALADWIYGRLSPIPVYKLHNATDDVLGKDG